MRPTILKTKLNESNITKQVCKNFTYSFKKEHIFELYKIDKSKLPPGYNIGYITGSSGSGKSLLLKEFGTEETPKWNKDEAICSHFDNYEDAVQRLQGVGYNSIPMWLVPRNILSTGQGYRVDLARSIKHNCVKDEFTSFIDRNTAMGLCNSLQRYIREHNFKNVVFSSVHKDIINYLRPDWVYDTDSDTLTINSNIYEVEDLQSSKVIKKEFMRI